MEAFLQKIQQRVDSNEFNTAIEQCQQSMGSFVRSYTALALLKHFDPQQFVIEFNKRFLNSQYDEETLKKEVEFYKKTLDSLPEIKRRLGLQ